MKSVQEALDALPKTADEIAALFEREGIKHNGGDTLAICCPLAVYLARECGRVVYVTPSDACIIAERRDIPLPDAVYDFRCRYDAMRYPNLRPPRRAPAAP